MHFVSNISIRGLRGDPYIRDDVCDLPLSDFVVECWSSDTVLYINPILAALVQRKRLLLKLWLLEEKNYEAYCFSLQAFDHTYFVITPIDQNKWDLEILIISSK